MAAIDDGVVRETDREISRGLACGYGRKARHVRLCGSRRREVERHRRWCGGRQRNRGIGGCGTFDALRWNCQRDRGSGWIRREQDIIDRDSIRRDGELVHLVETDPEGWTVR